MMFGISLTGLSVFGLWLSADLPFGTATRMGPGFIPLVLCWIGAGLGALHIGRGLLVDGHDPGRWAWRPLVLVASAIGAFMIVEKAGLFVAVVLVSVVASLGERPVRIKEIAILAFVLATFCALVFVKALGLPMPLWPRF